MAKKFGFGGGYTKSASRGKAVVAVCVLAFDIKGDKAIYRGYSPGPILDLDQLLKSGLFEEDKESGMLVGSPETQEDFEAIRRFNPLRGMDLLSAKNLYRLITVKFRDLSIFVELRGARRENSNVVDWQVYAVCPDSYDPSGEDISLDLETISSN